MKKMERRSLCLVLSADSDGKELADSIARVAKDEKWMIKKTLWLVENTTASLESDIKSIITKQSGIVVVHSRESKNELLFETIKSHGISTEETLWLFTDITEYGVPDIEALPVGMIKISARKRESHRDHILYSNAVYDALLLYQAAFERAHAQTGYDSPEGECLLGENGGSMNIQNAAKM